MRLELKIYDISHQYNDVDQSINQSIKNSALGFSTDRSPMSVRHVNPEVFNKSYSTPESLCNSSSNLSTI